MPPRPPPGRRPLWALLAGAAAAVLAGSVDGARRSDAEATERAAATTASRGAADAPAPARAPPPGGVAAAPPPPPSAAGALAALPSAAAEAAGAAAVVAVRPVALPAHRREAAAKGKDGALRRKAARGRQTSEQQALHAFCNGGLSFLISSRDFNSIAAIIELCEDGDSLAVKALLDHGLDFEEAEDRLVAMQFLASLVGNILQTTRDERRLLAVRAMLYLKDMAVQEPEARLRRFIETRVADIAAKGADALKALVSAFQEIFGRERTGECWGALRVLRSMGGTAAAASATSLLIRSALVVRDEEVRAFAAFTLGRLVAALPMEHHEVAGHGVRELGNLALLDGHHVVRSHAGMALKNVVASSSVDPSVARCGFASLQDMARLSLDPADRQIAIWRLHDLAMRLPEGETMFRDQIISSLWVVASEDIDQSTRSEAMSLLEYLALNLMSNRLSRHASHQLWRLARNSRRPEDRRFACRGLAAVAASLKTRSDGKLRREEILKALKAVAAGDPNFRVRANAAALLAVAAENPNFRVRADTAALLDSA